MTTDLDFIDPTLIIIPTALGSSPSWIATLVDPVIRADMTAASAGGTVSEAGMAKLFSDLAAELTADKTTLSASQLSDLKIIASDLNVGETASSYVTYITDALIDGNAANATWTGGHATATTLGNLEIGSTATQLSELTGKWFLGTDLPSDAVSMTGDAPFTVSYSAVIAPLYGSGGPSMNDVNQGYLGDCYLMSSLAEVAHQDPALIASMITANGNNTYGVRFIVDGTAEYVTVSNTFADGENVFNNSGTPAGTPIWASLIEQAYAQLQAGGVVTGNTINDGNSWSTTGNGGFAEYALAEITGATKITDFSASGSSWDQYVYNNSQHLLSQSSGLGSASVLSAIVSDLNAKDDLILSSNTNAYASNGMQTLVSDHCMSIYGYDSATGNLEVRNPWGSETGQTWETTFEVSLSTLLSADDTITADNVGADVVSTLGTTAINNIYEAVLQRPATQAEITNWLTTDASSGDAAVISQIVSLPEAQFNVYPVVQIIDLALGTSPTAAQLAGWIPYVESNGLIQGQAQTNALMDQMATAFVASHNFGEVYNNGTAASPNSAVTAHELQVLIKAATGVTATQTQINTWLGQGLTIDQVFVDFALGDQYTTASHSAIQQFLTGIAYTAASTQTAIVGSAELVLASAH